MGVKFVAGDLFLSRAQTFAHGCNCRGRMGAGIAVEFRRKHPEMFREYRRRCHQGLLVPGGYFLYKHSSPWILNLATQDTHEGAQMRFVEQCFLDFCKYYEDEGITSVAMPRIAAGLGGLTWTDVRTLICDILDPMPIPVLVYEVFQQGVKVNEDA